MASTTIIILMLFFTQGSLGHVLPLSPIVGIAGGHSVNIEDAPFMAALLHVDSNTKSTYFWCAGSIIHEQFVLTSARCIEFYPFIVRVGSTHYYEGRLHEVEDYFIHESYEARKLINNVGLLKLSEPVNFGPSVAAAKLADDSLDIPIELTAKVTGWGETDGSSEPSRNLRQVSVLVSPPEDCTKIFKWMEFTNKQICANTKGKGACLDDEGGPLIASGLQIGIASYGTACRGKPTVYEKIAPHLQWIRNKINQNL